jgi:hypothetical protein
MNRSAMHNAADMATPKPGEIRCPTCHRSTPPAAFCTQCGSAIPQDARARPRGMDRDELQDRIRARRSGGDPYRRGAMAEEDLPGYERFQPEPEDERARRAAPADQRRSDHLDERAAAAAAAAAAAPPPPGEEPPSLTRDRDEWMSPRVPSADADPTAPVAPLEPPRFDEEAVDGGPAPVYASEVDEYDDGYDDGYAAEYDYEAWREPSEERSGSSALAIVGFLALGVLALLGGALLAGVFGGDGTGQVDPTPTASVSAAPSISATPEATAAPSAGSAAPSVSPAASGGPIVFPDGFVAETQPCLPGSAGGNGCDSNAVSNDGSVWVWVGFENGTQNDVIGTELIGPDGTVVGEGSIDLARIGCRPTCPGGWTYFPFSGLPPGSYDVEVTRNGEPAATTGFEVN